MCEPVVWLNSHIWYIFKREAFYEILSQNETKWKILLHGNHLTCKQHMQSREKGRNQAFNRSLPGHMIFLNVNKREIWVEWCIQQQNWRQETSCESDQFSYMQGRDQGAKESPFGISVPLQRPLFQKDLQISKTTFCTQTNRDSVDQQISTHQVMIRKLFAKKTHRDRGGVIDIIV